jgi:hypothetical protein
MSEVMPIDIVPKLQSSLVVDPGNPVLNMNRQRFREDDGFLGTGVHCGGYLLGGPVGLIVENIEAYLFRGSHSRMDSIPTGEFSIIPMKV